MPVGPAQHGEQITVGDRELAAHQVVFPGKRAVDVGELARDAVLEKLLHIVGNGRVEQRAEVLVQLGADEVEPLLSAVTLDRPGGRHQVLAGDLVRDHLHDHGSLGQDVAIVHANSGDLPLGIEGHVVAAVFRFLGFQVDFDQIERDSSLFQGDMGR